MGWFSGSRDTKQNWEMQGSLYSVLFLLPWQKQFKNGPVYFDSQFKEIQYTMVGKAQQSGNIVKGPPCICSQKVASFPFSFSHIPHTHWRCASMVIINAAKLTVGTQLHRHHSETRTLSENIPNDGASQSIRRPHALSLKPVSLWQAFRMCCYLRVAHQKCRFFVLSCDDDSLTWPTQMRANPTRPIASWASNTRDKSRTRRK